MKAVARILSLILIVFFLGCSKEEPDPPTAQDPQQQPQPEPEPEPEPENQPPGDFTASVEVTKNKAVLSWTTATDPDGDSITYEVMLGDSLINTQAETSIELSDLIFEQEYSGKIIADDGNEHRVETTFDFVTGFLWLVDYEFDNGGGDGYSYQYNEEEMLVTIDRYPNGDLSNILYDSGGQLFSVGNVTYTHNANGLLTSISDGTGRGDLELLYDDEDRIRKVQIDRTSPTNNYVGHVEMIFNYNGIGNLSSIDWHRRYTSDNTTGTVNNYNRRQYTYDNDGNITEFLLENSSDGITYEESLKEQFTYDDKKDPFYSLLTRQLGINSRVYFGLRGEFDPQSAVHYSIEGYSIRFLASEHNVLTHKIYSQGDLILEYNYNYTYNNTGYPSSSQATVGSNEFFPRYTYNDNEDQ